MDYPHPDSKVNKISLFIAGAQKAGTTSLKHYLGEHPEICTHIQKEFAFFYNDDEFSQGLDSAYRKYFGSVQPEKKLVAKNAGLYVKEKAIRRLHEHNPDCLVVLIVRNPVDRAYSAFQMEKNYGNCDGDFDELINVVRHRDPNDWRYEFFIQMGMYAEYLRMIYRYFAKEQVIVIPFEKLISEPLEICQSLFNRLNVDPAFRPEVGVKYNVTKKIRSTNYARMVKKLLQNDNPIKKVARKLIPSGQDYKLGEMLRNINKTDTKPELISNKAANSLQEFYKNYNEELGALTGLDFSSWNKPGFALTGQDLS